jgi:biotin carboxyl carrier protein
MPAILPRTSHVETTPGAYERARSTDARSRRRRPERKGGALARVVIEISVSVGAQVKAGDKVAVMEAMKTKTVVYVTRAATAPGLAPINSSFPSASLGPEGGL